MCMLYHSSIELLRQLIDAALGKYERCSWLQQGMQPSSLPQWHVCACRRQERADVIKNANRAGLAQLSGRKFADLQREGRCQKRSYDILIQLLLKSFLLRDNTCIKAPSLVTAKHRAMPDWQLLARACRSSWGGNALIRTVCSFRAGKRLR